MRVNRIPGVVTSLAMLSGAALWLSASAYGDNQPEPLGEPFDDGSVDGVQLAENGNIVKAAGEKGRLVSEDGEAVFGLTVKEVEAVESCPSRGRDLERVPGKYLVAEVEVQMDSEIAEVAEDGSDVYFPMVAEAFSIYDEHGSRVKNVHTVDAWECYADDDLLPQFVFPGDHVSGYVVFETDLRSGTIAYMPGDHAGWQWEF